MSKPICIITARSGSKGLPHKNMLFFAGKPLLVHSIDVAIDSGFFDAENIYVSTDSEKYKKIIEALRPGVKVVIRKPELALDTTTSFEVLEDFLAGFEDDQIFLLLQPTSPLRAADDIKNAFKMLEEGAGAVVSFSAFDKGLDFYTKLDKQGRPVDLIGSQGNYRRQDKEVVYIPNGSIYLTNKKDYLREKTFFYGETRALITPPQNSVDIDNIDDFRKAIGMLDFDFLNEKNHRSRLLRPIVSKNHDVANLVICDERNDFLRLSGFRKIFCGDLTTEEILETLPKQVSASDKVVVALGVNDLIRGVDSGKFAQNYKSILDKISGESPKIVVIPILPVLFRAEIKNETIDVYNQKLRDLCQELGVEYAEIPDSIFEDGELSVCFTEDGLMLNEDGRRIIQDLFSDKK